MEKDKTKKEFDELLLEVRKVTRVTTWWRRMSFRATVLVWNKKGKIWLGLSKWVDVTSAVKKATNEAYKKMFIVPITKDKTVPYSITNKYKSCIVKVLPATQGTWLKAGSSVRSVLELAWYENVLSKIIGSNNKLNNAIACINALSMYKHADHFTAIKEEKAEKVEEAKPEKKVVEEVKEGKVEKKAPAKKTTAEKKAPAKKPTAKKVEKEEKVEKKAPAKKATAEKKAPANKATAKKTAKKEEK